MSSVLQSIVVLLREPNPSKMIPYLIRPLGITLTFTEDPLMSDIAEEYEFRRTEFEAKAADMTKNFASQDFGAPAT